MAKDKSKAPKEISDSGTLSIDREKHAQGMKTKEYKGSGGGTLLPVGSEFEVEITKLARTISTTDKTRGAVKFALGGRIDQGEYAGSNISFFCIAHQNTLGKFYKMLEVAFDVNLDDIDPDAIHVPSEAECESVIGKRILVSCDGHSPSQATQGLPREEQKLYNDISLVRSLSGGGSGGAKKKKGAGKIAK